MKIPNSFQTMAEYGRIGQKQYDGVFYEEYEKNLQGLRGIEVYKEMSESDSVIGAMLFAVEMLLRQADWNIEAAGDSDADKSAAEFVESCMSDMQTSWQDTISEILSFLIYGWSYHEICYKRRLGEKRDSGNSSKYGDGLIGWKKLPIRAQDTLWKWKYDESGELLGMLQMPPPDYTARFIPIQKALHFVTKSRKGNPEGRSILRSCYRDWYFKKRLQEFEGIGIERDLVGLPVLTPPENVDLWDRSNPDMVNAFAYAEALVRNVRRNEREGLVIPGGWTFQLLSSGGQRQIDVGKTIERYDTRIAMTILADFVFLGHQQTGSFALSSDKTELFSVALGTFMDIICEAFSDQAIPRLIRLNGEHFKGITGYPRMVHGDVEKQDVEKLIKAITDVVACGVLLPSEELSKKVCQILDLPEPAIAESVPNQSGAPRSDTAAPDLSGEDDISDMEKAWLGDMA